MKNKTRFEKRLDGIWWLLLIALPLLSYFSYNFFATMTDFTSFVEVYRFDLIANIFEQIAIRFSDTFPQCVVDYLSYAVFVEIMHVLYDFVVFIPRFAHELMEKCYA